MRQIVFNKKQKIAKKTIKILWIFFIHIVFFSAIIFTLFFLKWISEKQDFMFFFKKPIVIYGLIFAPILNTFCHNYYREKGYMRFRVIMWVHTMILTWLSIFLIIIY